MMYTVKEVAKSCSASSNKNSQTKIVRHIFVWLGLLPQMQAFEHRLGRGCENSVLTCVLEKQTEK